MFNISSKAFANFSDQTVLQDTQNLQTINYNVSGVSMSSSDPTYLNGFFNFIKSVNITLPNDTFAWEPIDIQWEENWADVANIQGQYEAGYRVSALFLTLGTHNGRIGGGMISCSVLGFQHTNSDFLTIT
jgi:hypothetical protein